MHKVLLLSGASAFGMALAVFPAHASPAVEGSAIAAVLHNVSLSSSAQELGVTLAFTGIAALGGTGVFLGVPVFPVVGNSPGSVTLSNGATFAFSLGTFGSFAGIVSDLALAPPGNRAATRLGVENATITPGAGLPDFLAGLATVAFSATQASAGTTRSNSASFTMTWPVESGAAVPGAVLLSTGRVFWPPPQPVGHPPSFR